MKVVLLLGLTVVLSACGGQSGELRSGPPVGPVRVPASPTADTGTGSSPAAITPLLAPRSPRAAGPGPAIAPAASGSAAPPTVTSGTASSGTASSGPGTLSSPPPSPSPRSSPTAVGGTVTVTDDDSGMTVYLAVGQHLRVRLSGTSYDPPVSNDAATLSRSSSTGGYPTGDPVDALFDANGHGTASVTAQGDAACFHTEPRCMMAARQWQVTVVVR